LQHAVSETVMWENVDDKIVIRNQEKQRENVGNKIYLFFYLNIHL